MPMLMRWTMSKLAVHTMTAFASLAVAAAARERHAFDGLLQKSSHQHSRELDIPHFIHQSWKDTTLPPEVVRWQASWKEKHPSWAYKCACGRARLLRAGGGLERDLEHTMCVRTGCGRTATTTCWWKSTTHGTRPCSAL